MGLVSALVYLLALTTFLPFAFKGDIVKATSGGGNKDVVIEAHQLETGRFLHRFPLEKVSIPLRRREKVQITNLTIACFVRIRIRYSCHDDYPWIRRRLVRHSMAAQVLHPSFCISPNPWSLLCRFWYHSRRGAHPIASLSWRSY